jgi:putative RNase toxin 24 of polymorphic toxin system
VTVWPGSAGGRRPWGVGSVAGWCARIVGSLPVSVLLGAATLVWLAGAWLAGAVGSTAVADSPTVVPVVSTVPSVGADGSDDQNAAGGGSPKSPGASHPQGNNNDSSGSTGGSTNSDSTPKQSGATHPQEDNSGGNTGSDSGTPKANPASHADVSDQGQGAQTQPRPAVAHTQDPEQGGAVKPAARPSDPNPDQTVVRPAGPTRHPEPGDGTTTDTQLSARKNGQPERPNPDCQGCGGTPAVPPTPAPVPSAGSGGAGSGGAGGTGGQPGIDNGARPGAAAKLSPNVRAQQPDGQVIKNKDPRTGLDPPAGDANTSRTIQPTEAPTGLPAGQQVKPAGYTVPAEPPGAEPCMCGGFGGAGPPIPSEGIGDGDGISGVFRRFFEGERTPGTAPPEGAPKPPAARPPAPGPGAQPAPKPTAPKPAETNPGQPGTAPPAAGKPPAQPGKPEPQTTDGAQPSPKDPKKPTDQEADPGKGGAALTKKILGEGKEWTGTGRAGGKLPKKADPNSILYRRNPQTGEITNYSVYDKDGNIVKRVDLNHGHGESQGPHTHEYQVDRDPSTGKEYPGREAEVRDARPDEIPG